MRFPQVALGLPDWVEDTLSEEDGIYPAVEDRVRLAIEVSRSNIRHGTGGPFGAAIFERETGQLLACGVNLVTSLGCSIFHAEMVAIMVAQSMIGDFELGGPGRPPYELVASTEPCAMCLGAAPWSGVRHLVCGARDEAASVLQEYAEKGGEIYPAGAAPRDEILSGTASGCGSRPR
jgi:tRNA(Arg) A34 adenosine deaminase TadA